MSASGALDDWISNGTAIATDDHYRWTADAYRELVDYDAGVIDNAAWLAALAALGGVPAMALEYRSAGDPHPRGSPPRVTM